MTEILAFFLSFFATDMTGPVAVRAAYVVNTYKESDATDKCCGACKGTGFITHGDGHKTPCPCPPDCICKAVRHPASVLKQDCPDGKCTLKK
jgi:hypothetical protein